VQVAFVIGGIPGIGQSGSTLASWCLISELLAAGHDVTAVLLPESSLVDETTAERVAALERLGARVRMIEIPDAPAPAQGRWRARTSHVRSLSRPSDDELFPAARAAKRVRDALGDPPVSAGIAFGIEAIAATAACNGSPPLLAVLSHPPGVSRRLRLLYAPEGRRGFAPHALASKASELSFLHHADRRTAALLRRFPSVGVFSDHHARWARKHGVDAWYAHYPLPDLAGPEWRERRTAAGPHPHPRILMIGHLRGIGTIAGLHLFVPEILPRLTQALGPDGFEVHVVGGQEPPERFRTGLEHPAVRLRGQLTAPEEEFFRADVLLAPNPTSTGASARILSGLSFGNCIVAHTDSVIGIPELSSGQNCLLASDGASHADAVLRALGDPPLRERLGDAARELYERSFSPPVAARRLVDEVVRLGSTSQTRR
jgi:glycosyltransferase involved in cell wall biosynthesis